MASRPCSKCGLNRSEQFFSGPRGRTCATCLRKARQRASKARSLMLRYGITLEEFEGLKARQSRSGEMRCAGCGHTRAKNYRWSVDHDHAIEREAGSRASIRGLVCRRCNKVLRDVRDDPQVLWNLHNYLWVGVVMVQAFLGQ